MIPYSLNTEVRKTTTLILVLLSMLITILGEMVMSYLCDFQNEILNNISSLWEFKLLVAVVLPPFIVWSGLSYIYSKWLWRFSICQLFHHIPNLNGKWQGYVINDKKKRPVLVTIEQDWNNIRIKTEIMDTNNINGVRSFSECKIAAIDIKCGEITLKYAYKNGLLGDKSYIGYNELEVGKNKIEGQYITSKPTKGVFDINRV